MLHQVMPLAMLENMSCVCHASIIAKHFFFVAMKMDQELPLFYVDSNVFFSYADLQCRRHKWLFSHVDLPVIHTLCVLKMMRLGKTANATRL